MSKIEQVKKHLESGKSITQAESVRLYGYERLSGGIYVLRQRGMNIVTTQEEVKDHLGNTCYVGRYSLAAHD